MIPTGSHSTLSFQGSTSSNLEKLTVRLGPVHPSEEEEAALANAARDAGENWSLPAREGKLGLEPGETRTGVNRIWVVTKDGNYRASPGEDTHRPTVDGHQSIRIDPATVDSETLTQRTDKSVQAILSKGLRWPPYRGISDSQR